MSVPELLLVGRITAIVVVAAVVRSGADETSYRVKADYTTEHKCTCIQTLTIAHWCSVWSPPTNIVHCY